MQPLSLVRERRAASIWTTIHPVFAITQLFVWVVSLVLLALYAAHVVTFAAVHVSVLIKIVLMVGAIVTGALWEHDVFGRWWFATEYVIEDAFTVNVFALHVAYLVVVYAFPGNLVAALALLAVAYVVYAVNVGQYIVCHHRMTEQSGDGSNGSVRAA